MAMTFDQAKNLLGGHRQSHVFRFWERLSERQRADLLAQVASLDFDAIADMQRMLTKRGADSAGGTIEPTPVIPLDEAGRADVRGAGEQMLRAGQVGVILVAGGQGTRLGFEGPKGCYPLAPITGASLFAIHSRKLLGLKRKYGVQPPFYIMTSQANDSETRRFFEENGHFGLERERVMFFKQGMWPAIFEDGRIVLDEPGHIFMSPDGHGGVLTALKSNGMLDDMRKRGLTTLFYFQVDNPLVEIADPVFIGLHGSRGVDMSVKVCAKRDPEEGLGVVARRGGRSLVVEYTELTRDQKHEMLPDGNLRFRFGSVAIHVFSLDFIQREADTTLPLHIARKKVPYCDENGQTVKPEDPNAYKFEKFIFDVMPDARKLLNVEFRREDEFSPVKNAAGADSPDMSRRDMMLKHARWLEQGGIRVPRKAGGELLHRIEIDPAYAVDAEDLRGKVDRDLRITGDLLLKG